MLPEESEIIHGILRNDGATAERLYRVLAPPLFKYVLSNNGTRDDARDLFQETYLRVLKNLKEEKYRSQGKFEAYFLGIAKNAWIDQLRARKKHRPAEENLLQNAAESDEDALFELILHDRKMNALHEVWADWEDTMCRKILQAFHFENVRTKDLAEAENTSQNTMLQRLYACRQKLFKLVSQAIRQN